MKFISLFYSIIFLDYQEICREEYIIFHKVNNLNFHKTLLKEFKGQNSENWNNRNVQDRD